MTTKTKIRLPFYICLGIIASLMIRNILYLEHPTMGEDLLDDLKNASTVDMTCFDDKGNVIGKYHIKDKTQVKKITDSLDYRLFKYKNTESAPKEFKTIAVLKFDSTPFGISVYQNGRARYHFHKMDKYFVADIPELKKACLEILEKHSPQPTKPVSDTKKLENARP